MRMMTLSNFFRSVMCSDFLIAVFEHISFSCKLSTIAKFIKQFFFSKETNAKLLLMINFITEVTVNQLINQPCKSIVISRIVNQCIERKQGLLPQCDKSATSKIALLCKF